jgi:hypothetical protein
MRLVVLESLSPYLSMHIKNVQTEAVRVLCINLKAKWSWTPRLTQSQTLQFRFGLDLHLGIRISLVLQHPIDVPHVLHNPPLHLLRACSLTRTKEE